MEDLVECVPNFSEGRDTVLIRRLGHALTASGLELLDSHSDPDHHRSVFTLVGPLGSVERAAIDAARTAVQAIDLNRHRGIHPRVGVLDVFPIVALGDASRRACIDAARRLGEELWEALGVPVYFYGQAASRRDRMRLESVRKFGFERLAFLVREGKLLPDVGGPELHPTAGACCVGVRKIMVAFNVLLAGGNGSAAKRIASAVRESSGGLPGVKALGLYLESSRLAQVSMNLTELDKTPVDVAFKAVTKEAGRHGVAVVGSELVGLVPRPALGPCPELLQIRGFRSSMILEERIRELKQARLDGGTVP